MHPELILSGMRTGVLLFSQDGRVATCVSRDPLLDKAPTPWLL